MRDFPSRQSSMNNEQATICIEGEINSADISVARQLHSKLDIGIAVFAVVFVVLVAWIIVDSVQAGDPEVYNFGGMLARIAFAVVTLAFLVSRRPWSPHEMPDQEVQRTIDREGIEFATVHRSGRLDWEDVIRSKHSNEMVILYTRARPAECIFPRRLFSTDEDWDKFLSWLETRTL